MINLKNLLPTRFICYELINQQKVCKKSRWLHNIQMHVMFYYLPSSEKTIFL